MLTCAMSRLIALFVAIAIALTSQAFALARGQASVSGETVICAGGGFVTVAVDAKGEPVGLSHFCPDAVLAFAATSFFHSLPPRPIVATPLSVWQGALEMPDSHLSGHPQARAPPVQS